MEAAVASIQHDTYVTLDRVGFSRYIATTNSSNPTVRQH